MKKSSSPTRRRGQRSSKHKSSERLTTAVKSYEHERLLLQLCRTGLNTSNLQTLMRTYGWTEDEMLDLAETEYERELVLWMWRWDDLPEWM